jgi:hypothetical protein
MIRATECEDLGGTMLDVAAHFGDRYLHVVCPQPLQSAYITVLVRFVPERFQSLKLTNIAAADLSRTLYVSAADVNH